MAVALALPLATAFNCTSLNGEKYKVCDYLENTDWSQSEKDDVIQSIIDSNEVSLNGDFESMFDKPIEDTIELNNLEEVNLGISDENKEILIDFSSMSIFGYIIYAFLKRYYFLLSIL